MIENTWEENESIERLWKRWYFLLFIAKRPFILFTFWIIFNFRFFSIEREILSQILRKKSCKSQYSSRADDVQLALNRCRQWIGSYSTAAGTFPAMVTIIIRIARNILERLGMWSGSIAPFLAKTCCSTAGPTIAFVTPPFSSTVSSVNRIWDSLGLKSKPKWTYFLTLTQENHHQIEHSRSYRPPRAQTKSTVSTFL